jgi:hypothetical protein
MVPEPNYIQSMIFFKGVLQYRRAEEGGTLITKLPTENLLSFFGGAEVGEHNLQVGNTQKLLACR